MAQGDQQPLGSEQRPLRVAVVGAGPSGFYAAEALQRQKDLKVEVDILDRLPTPYGLVRGGVAPDHQKIKSVVRVYEKIAATPGVRFYGNVQFGRDIMLPDLHKLYDHVLFAVGSEKDRRMGIPGEDLQGSHSATAFVGWYNGHPSHRDHDFKLDVERVAVIGVGNVAMDVTRILAKSADELGKTDIAHHALDELKRSKVKEVLVFGRRGPAQAAFSPAEIKEIGELEGVDLVVRTDELEADLKLRDAVEPETRKNLEYLEERAKHGEGSAARKVRLRFFLSPAEIVGANGRVTAVKMERTKVTTDEKGNQKARGTGEFETFPVGLVFRSVGYLGVPLPGVPFDAEKGNLPNAGGRIVDEGGKHIPGLYVVGWAKRGPSGLIGTNRLDAIETVKLMLEDATGKQAEVSPHKTVKAAEDFLRERQPHLVTFADWQRLDKIEVERGQPAGKIREKFTRVNEMLDAIFRSR
ncbi:MAG: FAD-dependent oxidoreductase [Myxococcota bacterium]